LAEAGAVCLVYNGHHESAWLLAEGHLGEDTFQVVFRLTWPTVTERMQLCHNDLTEATEYGACGLAMLVVREMTGLTVIERALKGTGIDYWLGEGESDTYVFERMARLEVSGILFGDGSAIGARIQQKLSQTRRSMDSGLPVYVVVVEFSHPTARVIRWEPGEP
jgi:hypothetical protein